MSASSRFLALTACCSLLALGSAFAPSSAGAAEVNVYSGRKDHLMKPLLDSFTAKTGIEVKLLSAKEEQLLERLVQEGADSPADVLITTDVARLRQAQDAGVLQATSSEALAKAIPAKYRDPQGYWYGLSARARVIFYAKDRVKPADLSTYEALADSKWKGKICVRSSSSVYNQSLLASIIAADGKDKASSWVKGIVGNMARAPQGGDRDQIQAVAAGECDIAIANTYYYAGMITSDKAEERDAAAKVALFWPNQNDRGAHVNVSGAGVTKAARHSAEALKLIEFLASPEAQKIYAEGNGEFPVVESVPSSDLIKSWGTFKAESINVAAIGAQVPEAVKLFDKEGWR